MTVIVYHPLTNYTEKPVYWVDGEVQIVDVDLNKKRQTSDKKISCDFITTAEYNSDLKDNLDDYSTLTFVLDEINTTSIITALGHYFASTLGTNVTSEIEGEGICLFIRPESADSNFFTVLHPSTV